MFPRPLQDPLPVWIAVGGSPRSVVRAGALGLPMALAIIGGAAERFKPMVDLYRDAAAKAGHDPAQLPVSINSHGFIAEDADEAAEIAFPPYAETMTPHRARARVGARVAAPVRGGTPASGRAFPGKP